MPSADFIVHEAEAQKNKPTIPGPYQSEQPPETSFIKSVLKIAQEATAQANQKALSEGHPSRGGPAPGRYPQKPAELGAIIAEKPLRDALGWAFAEAGVRPQLPFIEALLRVPTRNVEEAKAPQLKGDYIGVYKKGLTTPLSIEVELENPQVGYPGPDYPRLQRSDADVVFLHEAMHRLDDVMPTKIKKEAYKIAMQYYSEVDPTTAKWLELTTQGKNPDYKEPEAFAEIMVDFLMHHDDWPWEMQNLFLDYFQYDQPLPGTVPKM